MTKYVPIINEALAYEFSYTGKFWVLVLINSLCVPCMDHNLIPSFIMRNEVVIIIDVLKIHCKHIIVDYHVISFDQSDLRIPL